MVKRTCTAYQNASPYFDEKWQMTIPHYKAVLIVEMIDAANDRPVGSVTLSTYGLLQRDADAVAEGRDPVLEEDHVLREVTMHPVTFYTPSCFCFGRWTRVKDYLNEKYDISSS